MRKYFEEHPFVIYLLAGILFLMVGDLTIPAIIAMVFVFGKLEKTLVYTNISTQIQKYFLS